MNLGATVTLPEHHIDCRHGAAAASHTEDLVFRTGGDEHTIRLQIGQLSRKIITDLPNAVIDLIEIAAFVYAADAAVRRGGVMDESMGASWRRHFRFRIPVRCLELWSSDSVCAELCKTLGFLSDDQYTFEFDEHQTPPEPERFFKFSTAPDSEPETFIMFSGGLDSFAGALEELVERQNRVALISHHSSTKIEKVQADLVRKMVERLGHGRLLHIPVKAQIRAGSNKEGTHRTRSFLFAALGIATAAMYGKSRVVFFENGVVSLNLPPVRQAVGARATRTTHPQVLAGFSALFSLVLGGQYRVENPFFWRTKTDIVARISNLGFADQIRHTRSCADVHNLTTMHSHCGRCSQCIDRRFAVIACGLEDQDPREAYRVDLLHDARSDVRDREIALAYVRNAQFFRHANEAQFLQKFGEVSRALGHLDSNDAIVLRRIVDLHKRHGTAVSGVMDDALKSKVADLADPYSLLALYRADQTAGLSWPHGSDPLLAMPVGRVARTWTIRLDRQQRIARIDGLGAIRTAGYEVLNTMAEPYLAAAGMGLEVEDFPFSKATHLMAAWELQNEESVRKRISMLRRKLVELVEKAGLPALDQDEIIENHSWHGYRLNPDHIRIIIAVPVSKAKSAKNIPAP